MSDPDVFLPLSDPVWRDAYLIGGLRRVAEVGIASLLESKRLYDTEGMLGIRRGDHLAPEETIQRVLLNLVALDPNATTSRMGKDLRKTVPARTIEKALVAEGLGTRIAGRWFPNKASKAEAARLVAANTDATGLRAIAYAPRSASNQGSN